jgi:hypothetical protein
VPSRVICGRRRSLERRAVRSRPSGSRLGVEIGAPGTVIKLLAWFVIL